MFRIVMATAFGLAVLGVIVLARLGESSPAEAHGSVDQSQTTSTTVSFNNTMPMMQSFKPTASTLVAVDVKGTAPFGDEPNMYWTVAIRRDYSAGPIIALASRVGLAGTETVYHIDFAQPVAVTPGNTYWIEVAGDGNHFQWSVALSGNPYANGQPDSAFTAGYPDGDRYFVTYSAPPVTTAPATATPRPTRTPVR